MFTIVTLIELLLLLRAISLCSMIYSIFLARKYFKLKASKIYLFLLCVIIPPYIYFYDDIEIILPVSGLVSIISVIFIIYVTRENNLVILGTWYFKDHKLKRIKDNDLDNIHGGTKSTPLIDNTDEDVSILNSGENIANSNKAMTSRPTSHSLNKGSRPKIDE